jgi:hypothetical protein
MGVNEARKYGAISGIEYRGVGWQGHLCCRAYGSNSLPLHDHRGVMEEWVASAIKQPLRLDSPLHRGILLLNRLFSGRGVKVALQSLDIRDATVARQGYYKIVVKGQG